MSTRPVYERIQTIHNAIAAGKFPNCASLARIFESSTRTIHRDIDFMRYNLNLPIEYNPVKKGFYYTAPVDFPVASFSLTDVHILRRLLDCVPAAIRSEHMRDVRAIMEKMTFLGAIDDPEPA